MKIDWKKVCKSPGYISLKATYISDVQEAEKNIRKYGRNVNRDRQELLIKFKWVISRAIHYAYKQDTTVDVILNKWESDRTYWWLNYYQDCNQPKIYKHKHTSLGKRGLKKYYKRVYGGINYRHKLKSKKEKPRWLKNRKERAKKEKEYKRSL